MARRESMSTLLKGMAQESKKFSKKIAPEDLEEDPQKKKKKRSKFIPPDFDLSKVPKRTMDYRLRGIMKLPMSIRCNTCGKCYGKGRQFCSLMEDVADDDGLYRGSQLHILNCAYTCSTKFIVKTFPRNSDGGVVESGATRIDDDNDVPPRPRAEALT